MNIEEFFGVVAVLAFLGFLIFLPVRFFILIGQVKSLEKRVQALAERAPVEAAKTAAAPAPAVAVASVSAAPVADQVLPPPLPVRSAPAPASSVSARPDPLFGRLRDLGLLPPSDLKGEYALGAWWAVRAGGILAVAAVVFLGIWLNLRSTIPPIIRVLEVALVGAGLFWGGLRLSAKRTDLGQVVAAAGLAVWQFAAWATYGLDRMRVFDGPIQAAFVQFVVALAVAGLALWRGSKLFGQLAVVFAAVAVYFSIDSGAAPWPTAIGAGLIALLGVILMVRGPWGSAGVLGLIGSQACLLFLYDAMPSKDASYLPLQLSALGSFFVLWLGERLVKDDAVLSGRDARSAFQLAGFFAPSFVALFLATGGESQRATVSLLIAAVAALAGLLERSRNRLVCEVLLLAAVAFTGAGLAWLVDSHLVWLIWGLAAVATQVVGARTGSALVRWGAELLAGTAVLAFVDSPSREPWLSLAGLAGLALMLAFREDWERVSGWEKVRRLLGVVGLAVAILSVQDDFPRADNAWPWLVVLLAGFIRFRSVLLWAALPAYLFTSFLVVFWGQGYVGSTSTFAWAAAWAGVVAALNLIGLWWLRRHEGVGCKVLRLALGFASAVVFFAFAHHLWVSLLPKTPEVIGLSGWRLALIWATGAVLLSGVTAWLRRAEVAAGDLALVIWGAVAGFFIQGVVAESSGLRQLGLPQSPLVLLGLGCLLRLLAVHTKEQGALGTVQRSVLGAGLLIGFAFVMLAHLPGAGVSLFWALAAVLTFVLGHLLATRSLRMVGLVGLVIASARVLTHDITDMLGRIAACAAVAIAFFGIAWLYGRITADKRDA
ncbi:MAG: DUF2339 domain-containing protein [Verrucomicrobia bacterium]|nr:DUF2339 domain-containing protein [Verrucomicrobiota bacterium]